MGRASFDIPLPTDEFRPRRAVDPRRPNPWNDALNAAPRILASAAASPDGGTRVTLVLRRSARSLALISIASLAAAAFLALILMGLGLFGAHGYVFGLRRMLGLSGGGLLIAVLGMAGAFLWGRGNPTTARLAILRAVGLFGRGRG